MVNSFIDKINSLSPLAHKIMCAKGTEMAHSGVYTDLLVGSSYVCRRCGLALFRSTAQFDSRCGWPSFDESIPDCVISKPDWDGQRIEVCCWRCDSHLGHVFLGEELTLKNKRYCINACAIDLVTDPLISEVEEIIVAGGCFWGIEYYMSSLSGVVGIEVGYTGGELNYPTYSNIHSENNQHYEAVRVLFDPKITTCHRVLQYFFEIHDPTQIDGQGVDLGLAYQSAIFYHDARQKEQALKLISLLESYGYDIATKLYPATIFWRAEEEHQSYLIKHNKTPTCHVYKGRFNLDSV